MMGLVSLSGACRPEVVETPSVTIAAATATVMPSATPTDIPMTAEPSATKGPDVQGSISLWVDWAPAEITMLASILEAFQEVFPDVEISLIYFPAEQLADRFRAAAARGEQPTMILGDSQLGQALLAERYILDIRRHLTEELLLSVHPLAWEGVAVGVGTMGLPLSLEGIVLYRNAKLIPEAPETLEDLVRASQGMRGQNQAGIIFDVDFLYSGAFFSACNGVLLGADGSSALTLRSIECWLRTINQWGEAGRIVRNSDEDLLAFEGGEVAWLLEGTWQADRLLSALGGDHLAIDPWPRYATTGHLLSGYAWTRNIYFGSTSTERDFNAAWVLAHYLLTPEVQLQLASARSERQLPVLREIAFQERWLQELHAALQGNTLLPLYPEYPVFSGYLEQVAYDVGRRGYDLLYSVEWAYQKIAQDLARMQARQE